MENKYLKRSHISEAKTRQIVRLFCEDITATQIASLTGLNRNTVNRILTHIRIVIAKHCKATSPLSGEVEMMKVTLVRVACVVFVGAAPARK